MTERIYYFDSMRDCIEAVVTDCTYDEKRGRYAIEFDRTVFFPEGGGQFCDTGSIEYDGGSMSVDEVKEDKEGRIFHYCPSELQKGSSVTQLIDFEKRFERMQQHTGEHILSGLVNKYHGYDNVGFHLGDETTTLDFSGELTADDLKRLEAEANEVIWKNIAIKSYIPGPEELKALYYRSKKELSGDVRILEIPGVDICACCAPHMEHTGQVGLIKIIDATRHRGGMRVTIVAGKRALADYAQKHDDIRALSALLSMKQEDIAGGVERLMEDNRGYRERAIRDQEKVFFDLIEKQAGSDVILIFGEDINKVVVKHCIDKALGQQAKVAGVFSGSDNEGYSYSISSEAVDLRPLTKLLKDSCNARGGGKPDQINGMAAAPKARLTELVEGFLEG